MSTASNFIRARSHIAILSGLIFTLMIGPSFANAQWCSCPVQVGEKKITDECPQGIGSAPLCQAKKCVVQTKKCIENGTGEYCGCKITRPDGVTYTSNPTQITAYGCQQSTWPTGFRTRALYKGDVQEEKSCTYIDLKSSPSPTRSPVS